MPNPRSVTLYDRAARAAILGNTALGTVPRIPVVTGTPPPTPTVTLSADVSKAEGAAGSTTVYTFTVTLSEAPSSPVVVSYSFSPGTTNAADYPNDTLPTAGSVTVGAGQTQASYSFTIRGDGTNEPDEYFTTSITAPSGYAAGAKMSATGNVLNDDAAVMPLVLSNNRIVSTMPATRPVGVFTGIEKGATLSLVSSAGNAVDVEATRRELRVATPVTTPQTLSVTVRKTQAGGRTDDYVFSLDAGVQPFATDDFAGTSGADVNGRVTLTGGRTWAGTSGRWTLDSSGRAQHSSIGNSDRMTFDVGQADHLVEAVVRSHVTGGSSYQVAEIQFRGTETATWYVRADARNNRITVGYVTNITLGTTTGGTLVKEWAFYQNLNGQGQSPSSIRLGARVKGDTITVYANRVRFADIVSPLGSGNTRVGFAALAGAGTTAATCTVDDFFCEPSAGVHVNWPTWTPRSLTTPIVPRSPGTFDATDVNNPQPFRDPIGNRWLMGYSGYNNGDEANTNPDRFAGSRVQHLGLAQATSLAGPWTKLASTPSITADATLDGIYAFNGGTQYSEAAGKFINVGVTSAGTEIGLWTSDTAAPGSWTRVGVIRAKTGWCVGGVFDPCLAKLPDGTFEMWYAGEQTSGASGLTATRAYGRMTSLDGLTWTEDPANPRLYPRIGNNVGSFLEQHQGEPQTYRVPEQPGQMLVHFDGVVKKTDQNAAATADRHVHAAASFDDGGTWIYRVDALQPAGTGFMSNQVFDSHMERDTAAGISRLFYAAAPREGAALNLFIELGDATGPTLTNLAA